MVHRKERRRATVPRRGIAGDPARARLAEQGRPVPERPPLATREQRFQLGGQNVTEEEFRRLKDRPPPKTPTASPEELRKLEELAQPELPRLDVKVSLPQPAPEQPQQQFGTDVVTGEQVPLFSGSVSSAEDVVQALTPGGAAKGATFLAAGIVTKRVARIASRKIARRTAARVAAISLRLAKGALDLRKWALRIGGTLVAGGVLALGAAFTTRRITAADRIIKSIESDLGLMSEQIPDITAGVRAGGDLLTPEWGMEQIATMREDINNAEEAIKLAEIKSLEIKTNPEFTASAWRRIDKQRTKLDISQQLILIFAANPQDPKIEELAVLLEE